MKGISRLAVFLLAVFLAGCGGRLSVDSTLDSAANFSRYRSFGFALPANDGIPNSERLRAALRQQMEARGYAYVQTNPDVEIEYSLKFTSVSVPMPLVMPGGSTILMYQDQMKGLLLIDIVDRARPARSVWQGQATTVGNTRLSEKIEESVAKVFERYPFRAGSGVAQPAR